jgi:hypothetical protein
VNTIGQEELIEILEKLTKPASRGEIAKIGHKNPIWVSHMLCKLIQHKEVFYTEINSEESARFGCRRTIKLYYLKKEVKHGR